ncbi:MAG: hypothetical protein JWM93_2021 [Frankiales bacterium]|nr:hypothetical protein [Frankiales bacterium]
MIHLSAALVAVLAVLGSLAPHLVAIANQPHWRPWVKTIVSVLVSVVIAVSTLAAAGQLEGKDLAAAITLVFAASQLAYGTYFRRTAQAVEYATLSPAAADAIDAGEAGG